MTAIRMEPIGEYYSKTRAIERLEAGEIVIIAGGTGNPFFTTDTASSLRGIEVEADVMLKGTRVDGIYTADPEKDPSAVKFDEITFDEIYRRNLKVMDLTATTMCKENGLPLIVFDMDTVGNLKKVMLGSAKPLAAGWLRLHAPHQRQALSCPPLGPTLHRPHHHPMRRQMAAHATRCAT